MNKSHLFFDIDGMKFHTMPAQIAYANKTYGINILPEEYHLIGHYLDSVIKKHRPDITLSREEIYTDWGKNFLASKKWHRDVLPMEGMPRVMKELPKKYIIHDVTARQSHGIHVIKYLLDKFIPGCVNNIHCVWTQTGAGGFIGVTKKAYIASVQGKKDGFFDDSLHEIEETKAIIPSYLFDHVNLHSDVEGADIVRSWEQIGDILL